MTFNRPLALLVSAASFMESLDGTIVQAAAPRMAETFGVRPEETSAAAIAYLVAAAAVIPLTGWLAQRFGARSLLLTAISGFTLASMLCALAPTLLLLTSARVVQGIAGAAMVPAGRLAVFQGTRPQDLLDAVAYVTWPALVAPVVAPALGGILVDTAGWHWIFLINLPFGVVALVAGLLLIPKAVRQAEVQFDIRGFTEFGLALVLAVIGAQWMGAEDTRMQIVGVSAVVAALALGSFAIVESRKRALALFDWDILHRRSFRAGVLGGSAYRMIITAAPFLFTLLFQVGYGLSATAAGTLIVAIFVGNLGIKPFTKALIRRFGFRRILISANALGVLIFLVFAIVEAEISPIAIAALLVVSGASRSIGFSAYNTLQFVDLSPSEINNANSLSMTLQRAAIALGLALAVLLLRIATTSSTLVTGTPNAGFYWVFVLAAAMMMVPLIGAARLPPGVGDLAIGESSRR